ncbi:MAG: hypothetical protein HOQ35_16695, partial [Acidobacteriaceae bacterium]|nr:hypothetical protein [Acidobacteriaceae bacterium]
MSRLIPIVVASLLSLPSLAQTTPEDLVHPLTGTQNEGQTYPAVGGAGR